MGALLKLVDATLIVFFIVIAVAAPLLDSQIILPRCLFPDWLVELQSWLYVRILGHYLVTEKHHFFVGLVWLQLLLQWPLALANLYGILAAKSWFNTTCLIYGVSFFGSIITELSELVQSGKASDMLIYFYFPFLGLAVLAILRGLLPPSCKTTSSIGGKRPTLGRKKKA